MDEERLSKKVQAWVLAPMYWWNAATLPAATMWLKKSVSNLKDKWIKQVSKEMAKNLAKKKAIKTIWKIWAKMWAKHLAWLAPAATWVWAVAVPVLEWALILDDIHDLYNLSKDNEFKEWVKYLAEDTVNWVSNFVKNNPKESIAAAISPLWYITYKAAKKAYSNTKNLFKKDKVYPITTMPDWRTKYSDWTIK